NPQLVEFKASTLVNDISDNDTDIEIADASNFPSVGILSINNELIRYTSKVGNTLSNAQRGYKNTKASSHSANDPVGIYDNLYDNVVMISPNDKRWYIRPSNDGIAVFPLRDYNSGEYLRNQNG